MKKLFWLLLLLPCVLVVGCSKNEPTATVTTADTAITTTQVQADEPSKPTTEETGPLPTSIELGKIRVQLLSDRIVRIEVKGPKGFEDRASYTVQKRRNWEDVAYTSEAKDGYMVITTSVYKVYIPDNAKTPVGCYITD